VVVNKINKYKSSNYLIPLNLIINKVTQKNFLILILASLLSCEKTEDIIINNSAQNVYSVETIDDKVYIGTYDGYLKVLIENNI